MSTLNESEKAKVVSRFRAHTQTRFWRYAPLVGWMAFVFFASSDEFSAGNTSKILRPLLLWLFPQTSETTVALAHFIVRKLSHFTEYAVLALLAARAFLGSSHTLLKRRWFFAALLLVVLYALMDEFHQSFVPSRKASIYDSLIDTAGGLTALLACAVWHKSKPAREN
ncbi:MAG: VanZ family protein [Pyrinomonadaceae bacterium]